MQYKVCRQCGAHLDFGERCDCRAERKEAAPLHRETASGERTPKAIIVPGTSKIKAVIV